MDIKIKTLIEEMTLEEKASLCSGLDFWCTKPVNRMGVPSVAVSDGPHGLRKENDLDDNVGLKQSFPATSFPPAVNIASTWDHSLAKAVGEELAKQCIDQKVSVILGPGTNIKRSPLCGRNFEYFSEDPVLAGRMCVNYIDGVQKHGIGTSLKHYACNSQEHLRMTINEIVDERTLREIYLPAFETAVKESQPWTVMCSYNRLNGTYLSDNEKMLDSILRKEWGFKGLVVSDWNATNDRVQGIRAGMDLEMPSSMGRTDKQIMKAVKDGSLKEEELDKVIERLLTFIFKCQAGLDDNYSADYGYSHAVARRVAESSMVLLKNEDDLLPLTEGEDVAIIGALAKNSRYQGSGSSRINPYNLVNFLDHINALGTKYAYADGYNMDADIVDDTLIAEAVAMSKNREKVVVFVGLTDSYECEGYDRSHLNIPESHNKLIDEILKVNKNVSVVVFGGSPIAMPWVDNVKAILNAYLPGEAGFEALYDILFGKVNPSGRLAETYPIKNEDFIGAKYYGIGPRSVEHRESVYVGYRYYTSANKKVLFPFGYGLSYTTFEYSNMTVSANSIKDSDSVTVTVDVTNAGKRSGEEVVEVFVSDIESTIFRPKRELKDFAKIKLEAGETKTVSFTLSKRAFAYYNVNINDWHVESGEFDIEIAKNADEVVLSKRIFVESTANNVEIPNLKDVCPSYYDIANATELPKEEFEAITGFKMPSNAPAKRGEFDFNTTIGDLKVCLIGKIIAKLAPAIINSQVPNADMTTRLMLQQGFEEMPLRSLNGVTTGLLDMQAIYGFLLWGNKKRLRGLGNILAGMIKSLKNIKFKNEQQKVKKEQMKKLKEKEKELKETHKEELKTRKIEMKAVKEEHKDQIKSINDEKKSIKKSDFPSEKTDGKKSE